MVEARYDDVADFYVSGWPEDCHDPATAALLGAVGDVCGLSVLDLACGHGRVSRELARRGAHVVGVDVSRNLLQVAQDSEQSGALGIEYRWADLTSGALPESQAQFDLVVCNFGLSDIDDLDATLTAVTTALRNDGRFVASMLHPCFPGAADVSGAWAADRPYSTEGRWLATGRQSSLRRQVGANHRKLSTYLNALVDHGLRVETVVEPDPAEDWAASRPEAARLPVFLVIAAAAKA